MRDHRRQKMATSLPDLTSVIHSHYPAFRPRLLFATQKRKHRSSKRRK